MVQGPHHRPTILADMDYLNETKQQIEQQEPKILPAYNRLLGDADIALLDSMYTVTDKLQKPPSGNPHDYASYSRYWWPDPDQPQGLPYIRKDGETNPESQSPNYSDRPRLGTLSSNTETLGLAYYFTGDQRYADKAAGLIRTWFLDEATYMNPNLNHAQCRPGHNLGSKSGVLDGRLLISAMEASLFIAESGALSHIEYEHLRSWALAYWEWLTTDEMALQEAQSKNNHGSYYDVQAIYFALYSGQQDQAKQIAQQFMNTRILQQIKADGSMPEELARTRPLFYSLYNLHAMFLVAHLAEQVNIDLWQADQANAKLRAALDYLAPYANPELSWPQDMIGPDNRMEIYPLLQMAHRAYPDGNYLTLTHKLPIKDRMIERCNLALPLIR